MNPETLIKKAQDSKRYLKILNISLSRIIPFNKPHRIKVTEIGDGHIITTLPYRKSNFNHIRGLHACGLATLAEFTTGMSLLRKLDTKKYRLIMKQIQVQYHFQGKFDAYAKFEADDDWVKNNVITLLENQEKIDVPVTIEVKDAKDNLLATADIIWQVKDWEKVKTAV